MNPLIHITTEPGWICRQLADHLKDLEGFRVQVSTEPPKRADLTYFLTYLFREFYQPVGRSAALFTHYEPGKHQQRYDRIAKQIGRCIVLSSQHHRYLGEMVGWDRVSRVHLPVSRSSSIPPLKVGWFHRSPAGYGRRKRVDVLQRLQQENDWLRVVRSDGKLSVEELRAMMLSVDVFLTTSEYESGPASLLEGLSLGKPVVIPTGCGLADEYGDVPGVRLYQAGNVEELASVLRETYEPLRRRYSAVSRNTVEQWRADHARIFRECLA